MVEADMAVAMGEVAMVAVVLPAAMRYVNPTT